MIFPAILMYIMNMYNQNFLYFLPLPRSIRQYIYATLGTIKLELLLWSSGFHPKIKEFDISTWFLRFDTAWHIYFQCIALLGSFNIICIILSSFYCQFLAVPLASGQVHISTSWVCHWVADCLTDCLTAWVTKLKISVNIDARTLKFGMEHPWAHWLRFRKIQFEGPDGNISLP